VLIIFVFQKKVFEDLSIIYKQIINTKSFLFLKIISTFISVLFSIIFSNFLSKNQVVFEDKETYFKFVYRICFEKIMKIGNIEFERYPVFLAPMEDVTDIGFRLLCKKFGADMVY